MPFTAYDVAKVRRFLGYPANPQISSNIQVRLNEVQVLGETEVTIAQANLRRLDEISNELKRGDRAALVAEARRLINELSTQLSLTIWSDIFTPLSSRVVRG